MNLPVDLIQNPPARIHRQAQNPPDFRKNPLMCLLSKIHPPVLLWYKVRSVVDLTSDGKHKIEQTSIEMLSLESLLEGDFGWG